MLDPLFCARLSCDLRGSGLLAKTVAELVEPLWLELEWTLGLMPYQVQQSRTVGKSLPGGARCYNGFKCKQIGMHLSK